MGSTSTMLQFSWSGIVARDSRLASSTSSLSLCLSASSTSFARQPTFTHFVDSEGARHRLLNVYAADKCTHSARSAAHRTCALMHTTGVRCLFCLSKLSSCESRPCLSDGSLSACLSLVLASCSVSLLHSLARVSCLYDARRRVTRGECSPRTSPALCWSN